MKLGIACDHAGFETKEELKVYLNDKGFEVTDYGTHSSDSMDYPDTAHPLAKAVEAGEYPLSIALCGSGNGISITLNKHQGIRSALCWTKEIAALARQHNDANICTIPARFVSFDEAKEIADTFLSTGFEGGRHQKRVNKIPVK